MAAEDLSVEGSLTSNTLSPLLNSNPRYARLSSADFTMLFSTNFTFGFTIATFETERLKNRWTLLSTISKKT